MGVECICSPLAKSDTMEKFSLECLLLLAANSGLTVRPMLVTFCFPLWTPIIIWSPLHRYTARAIGFSLLGQVRMTVPAIVLDIVMVTLSILLIAGLNRVTKVDIVVWVKSLPVEWSGKATPTLPSGPTGAAFPRPILDGEPPYVGYV